MIQYERIDASEGIDLTIGILKTLVINMNHMFVMDVMNYQ